jgi:hypothetical protein
MIFTSNFTYIILTGLKKMKRLFYNNLTKTGVFTYLVYIELTIVDK